MDEALSAWERIETFFLDAPLFLDFVFYPLGLVLLPSSSWFSKSKSTIASHFSIATKPPSMGSNSLTQNQMYSSGYPESNRIKLFILRNSS